MTRVSSSGFWKAGSTLAAFIGTCLLSSSFAMAFESGDGGEQQSDNQRAAPAKSEKGPKAQPPEQTIAELIEELTNVSQEGIGFHSTAWTSGFIALDEDAEFHGGVLGSRAPTVSPVMRRIVRRGVDALPELISHLTDERETNLVVGGGIIMAAWHAAEYDSRYRDDAKIEGATQRDAPSRYRVRVGDLCYVAIGQIVNRRLSAVRYQPSGCMVVNSPVATPGLAQAVKADWDGLTADELRKSLVADCLNTTPYADWGAWQRVRFYYPRLAEQTALQLLKRPIYDQAKLWDFIYELVKEQDESKWRTLIDKYVEENGQAVNEVLPFWLYWIFWDTDFAETPEHLAGRATAKRILARVFPTFDRHKPAFLNAANVDNHATAVNALSSYPSKKIDQAVFEVFLAATDFQVVEDEQYKLAGLADACLTRLGNARFEVDGEPDVLLKRIRKIINSTRPSQDGYYDTRFVALQSALRFFPKQSKDLFDGYRCHSTELTRYAKMYALREPTDPQPWMVEFLASLLEDTTKTVNVYGPEWDRQPVRICDQAAKLLADDYLPKYVRFEFEQDPAYLTAQIAKIRRVLSGEQNISFDPPPEAVMPKELPSFEAKRVVELDDFGTPYAFSSETELWIGDGFRGRGGWAYDTLRFELSQGKVVERMALDQWKGGVNILENGSPNRAYCYHAYEGGHVLIRDLRTGRVLKKVRTPFHGGIAFDDPLQVRNLGDVTLSGEDSRWILALTQDLKLHSIDTRDGKHRIEWEYEREQGERTLGGGIIGLRNSSKVLLEDVGGPSLFDAPLRIWDQSARSMTVFDKSPRYNWQGGWGDLAWNSQYGEATLWNLARRQQIPIPRSEHPIELIVCDSDQSTMFALRAGAIDVFRVIEARAVQPTHRLVSATISDLSSISMVVSSNDRYLFLHGWHMKDEEQSEEPDRAVVVIFDVSELAK